MNSYLKKSLTLIELLIAVGLLSVIILAISNIDLFTRFHTISADRRAKLQNDASYILEHMTKQISRAIGNERTDGARQVINDSTASTIKVYIDKNDNGRRDSPPDDCWIAYRRITSGVNEGQLQYCPQCTDSSCTICTPNDWATVAGNPLSNKIADFTVNKPQDASNLLTDNYVEIALTARWDPDPAQAVSSDNPEVVMRTKIKMPSVSTH